MIGSRGIRLILIIVSDLVYVFGSFIIINIRYTYIYIYILRSVYYAFVVRLRRAADFETSSCFEVIQNACWSMCKLCKREYDWITFGCIERHQN